MAELLRLRVQKFLYNHDVMSPSSVWVVTIALCLRVKLCS